MADTENHAIRAVDLKAKQVKTVAGTGQQSLRQNGKGPGDKTRLNSPWDVLLLPGTNVLAIAMAGPHQIWKLDLKTGQVGVWAGSGTEDIIDGSLGDSAFAQPSGLATDGKYLFVADSEVSGIRTVSITPSGGRVGRLVGLGLFEFGDVDGIGPTVRLQHCLGVAYNEGSLYIADSYNNKIKVCDPKTRAVKTLVGTHRAGDADSPPQFDEPGGLSVGGKTLYVADTNNHAIRTVDLETNKVATLAISGIEPPPSSKRPPSFPNPVVATLPPAKVAPGSSVSIDVALALPEGFKLSPDAPLPYLVEATGGASVLAPEVSPEGSTVDPPSPKFTVKVPLAKARAAGDAIELKLSVASIICRSGATGVCMPKSYVWTVPIRFIDGGPERIEVATPAPVPAAR